MNEELKALLLMMANEKLTPLEALYSAARIGQDEGYAEGFDDGVAIGFNTGVEACESGGV